MRGRLKDGNIQVLPWPDLKDRKRPLCLMKLRNKIPIINHLVGEFAKFQAKLFMLRNQLGKVVMGIYRFVDNGTAAQAQAIRGEQGIRKHKIRTLRIRTKK